MTASGQPASTSDRPVRHRILPCTGSLIISTDLHGNGDDFRRMRAIFEARRTVDPETHLLDLGTEYGRAGDIRDGVELRRLYD